MKACISCNTTKRKAIAAVLVRIVPAFLATNCYASEMWIASHKSKYAVAEPVTVTVFVKNTEKEPLLIWPDVIQHQMIYLEFSQDGKNYKKIEIQDQIINIGTYRIELQPGEVKGYVFRVLVPEASPLYGENEGTSDVEKGKKLLLFKHPGAYIIQASTFLRSQRIACRLRIHIHPPQGESAVVWRKINDPGMLYFLQFGRPLNSDFDVVKRAVRILQEHKDHVYYDDLAWALRVYYQNQVMRRGGEPFPERDPIQKLLSLPIVENFFSATEGGLCYDRRLRERQVVLQAGNFDLDELLKQATIQTGVFLSYDKSITGNSRIEYPGGVLSLRQFMRQLTEVGTVWVRRGDGYRLEVVPADKK